MNVFRDERIEMLMNNKLASAMQALNRGNLKEASSAFQEILTFTPEDPDALHGLGIVRLQQGDAEGAIRALRGALRKQPDNHELLVNLAGVLRARGGRGEAIMLLEKAAALSPESPRVHKVLGDTWLEMEYFDRAEQAYEKMAELSPDSIHGRLGRAKVLLQQGFYEEAGELLSSCEKHDPDNPEVLKFHGLALWASGSLREARERFIHLAWFSLQRTDALVSAARIDIDLGQARQALERIAVLQGEGVAGAYPLSVRAKALEKLGKWDEAVEHYQMALEANRGYAPAWLGLAEISPDSFSLANTARLEEMAEGSPPEYGKILHYARARILEDKGEWAREMRALHKANELARHGQRYDRDAVEKRNAVLRRLFDRAFLERARRYGNREVCPVFIMGMPRSGTSWAELFLSRHSRMHHFGESPALRAALQKMEGRAPGGGLEAVMARPLSEVIAEFSESYLQHISKARVPQQGEFFTDTVKASHRFVGLLAAAFPRARFIHMDRDPQDICLSCYKKDFQIEHYYSSDLEDCAFALSQFNAMIDYWRTDVSIDIATIRYEDLVSDHERTVLALLEHVGLPWEDGITGLHEEFVPRGHAGDHSGERLLEAGWVGQWKQYGEELDPLRRAFKKFGVPLYPDGSS